MSKVELIHGDCFEELKKIPEASIPLIVTDPIEKSDGLSGETANKLCDAFQELHTSSEQLRKTAELFWCTTLETLVNQAYIELQCLKTETFLRRVNYNEAKWYNKCWRKFKWRNASKKQIFQAGMYYLAKEEYDDFLKQIKEKV